MSQSPLSLRHNFWWTLAGNVIFAATQWGVLVSLARFGTPETVGQFALGFSITAPIIMFSNLQLRGVKATDAMRTYPFTYYLILRTSTTTLALLVITGIVYIGTFQGTTELVIVLIGLAKALESISDIYYGLLQQRERMDRIAQSLMLRGVLSVVVVAVLFYMTGSLVAAVAGMATVWAVTLALFDVPNGSHLLKQDAEEAPVKTARFTLAFVRQVGKLALSSLPLGFVMLLSTLNSNIPRYFIDGQLGTWELGIFVAMAYLMVPGITIVNALGQSASPRLSQLYAAGESAAFRILLGKLAGIGFVLGGVGLLAASLFGEPLLRLLYGEEYAAFSNLFEVLMVAAGLTYIASFMGYGMTAARLFPIQVPVFILTTLATIVTCLLLVPSYGLYGGAWALIISATIQLVLSVAVNLWGLTRISQYKKVSK